MANQWKFKIAINLNHKYTLKLRKLEIEQNKIKKNTKIQSGYKIGYKVDIINRKKEKKRK